LGFQKRIKDPRLVFHDRTAARQEGQLQWEASKDDRMSAEDAGRMMKELYRVLGVVGAKPQEMEAIHDALYFAHTLNGASVLAPGRAYITIGNNRLDYSLATSYLGNENRRFHRAYADEIRECNLRVLAAASDSYNIVAVEKAGLLKQVAAKKGLQRYPSLAHDTADACHGLTDSEYAALVSSKVAVFSSTPNMADRNRVRPGQSADTAAGNFAVQPGVGAQHE